MPGKKKKKEEAIVLSSWKKDEQKLKLDLNSKPARSRLYSNFFLPLCILVVFTVSLSAVVWFFKQEKRNNIIIEYDQHIEIPILEISGNSGLPEIVIKEIVNPFVHESLSEINVFLLKEELEACGQIKKADVIKDFPNTLKIHIIERQPTLMLATMDEVADLEFWGVDDSGVVFSPYDLERMKALELPFLQGIKVDQIEDGVTQIAGVDKVHYLLQLIEHNAYSVYNDIKSISLEKYEEGVAELGAVIIIYGKQLKKIIFGVDQFEYQVTKLIGVLSASDRINLEKKEIDLSYSGDAIIR